MRRLLLVPAVLLGLGVPAALVAQLTGRRKSEVYARGIRADAHDANVAQGTNDEEDS